MFQISHGILPTQSTLLKLMDRDKVSRFPMGELSVHHRVKYNDEISIFKTQLLVQNAMDVLLTDSSKVIGLSEVI